MITRIRRAIFFKSDLAVDDYGFVEFIGIFTTRGLRSGGGPLWVVCL